MKYLLKTVLFFVTALDVFILSSEASNYTTQLPSTKSKAPLTTNAENEISTTSLLKSKPTTLIYTSSSKARSNHTSVPTTSVPKITCEQRNSSSCSFCTEDIECYWCGPSSRCMKYDTSRIVPRDCKDNKWFWKQCFAPGYVLIIVVPSLAGLLLLSCGCFIYCKCCRTRSKRIDKEDRKFRLKRKEIQQRNEQRRAERRQKTDAMRRKYGLLKDDDDDDDSRENQIV